MVVMRYQRQAPLCWQAAMSGPAAWLMALLLGSEAYCQCAIPPYQLYCWQACSAQLPKSLWATNPVLQRSVVSTGFPTTIFLKGTPLLAISRTAVPLKGVPEALTKSSLQVSYWDEPWLQNWTMQKSMRSPTSSLMVLQAPFWQNSCLKQGAWGQWLTTWLGMTERTARVKATSHPSPSPAFMAALSSQSMLTPSRLLLRTKRPREQPQVQGSMPAVVGNSVEPKALINTLMLLSLQIFFKASWISCVVFPKSFTAPKQVSGSIQGNTASMAPFWQLQNARMMQLQLCGGAYPGTARLAAIWSGAHDTSLLMKAARMGYWLGGGAATARAATASIKSACMMEGHQST